MTSPFGPEDESVPGEELVGEIGEGEPDETSDDTGAGGEEPAAR
jgi:hypothetical protein